jgi:hypothetical protein
LRELIGNPLGCWMRRDPKPQDLAAAMSHDQQSIQ